jgi:hypothetical protein
VENVAEDYVVFFSITPNLRPVGASGSRRPVSGLSPLHVYAFFLSVVGHRQFGGRCLSFSWLQKAGRPLGASACAGENGSGYPA